MTISPIVLVAPLFAVASAACVAAACLGRRSATRGIGLPLLALVLVPTMLLAGRGFADPTYVGELAAVALALACPALCAQLVLERRWWERVLAVAVCAVALPLVFQGAIFFARAEGWPLVAALAVHALSVVAVLLRALAPERLRRPRAKLAEPIDARAHP